MAQEKVREVYRKLLNCDSEGDTIDIGVTYDGSWHKRGQNSNYGVFCVVEITTGLVIDFEIMSKYYHKCIKAAADLDGNSAEFSVWQNAHVTSGACEKNYEVSSGSMEVKASAILWKRSIAHC